MKRALISVYDKTGAAEFAQALAGLGFEIVSTGGTLSALRNAGVAALSVEEVTGFPEMMDGRVKTLHPKIHGGILAVRDDAAHLESLAQHGIGAIDIVAVNLYPFKAVISRENAALADAIENIDIGGPAMVRSAAKNFRYVTVVTDPADYPAVLEELRQAGSVSEGTRFSLAARAFAHTAAYDALIAEYLNERSGGPRFPRTLTMTYEKAGELSYGENPHQGAAFYRDPLARERGLADAERLHGRELSYNNINDAGGALALLAEFDEPAAVACKHANPCGAGTAASLSEAYQLAYAADPVSIFGGILAFNRELDEKTARLMEGVLLDLILAPSYAPGALEILKKRKNTRVLRLPWLASPTQAAAADFRRTAGGMIAQEPDTILFAGDADIRALPVATARRPTESEYADLLFAWRVVKHVKSNAIVIGKNGQTVGIGCGQVSRIWAAEQAIDHGVKALGAGALSGAAMASDAFFPFDDCVRTAAAAGITAVIQPGGSVRDADSVRACDELGLAMVITGTRHFRH